MNKQQTDDTRKLAALALALTAREPDQEQPPLDLYELDRWRRGQISGQRYREILAQLVDDPLLMRQLEALERPEQPSPPTDRPTDTQPGWPARLQDWAEGLLPNWGTTPWVGVAASLLLALALLPALHNPALNDRIDALYDPWDQPPALERWPWRAPEQTKSLDLWPDPGKQPESQDQQAFRYGLRQGLERLGAGGEPWRKTLARLPSTAPNCSTSAESDCKRLDLLRASGQFMLAVYWRCPQGDARQAALAAELHDRWRTVAPGHPLVAWIGAIKANNRRCPSAVSSIDWAMR